MTNRDEAQARAYFSERYALPDADALGDIERRVLGDAWGVNGYTTVAEVDAIARILQLGPGRRLLDVGTGRGFPAIYLAARTGCAVIGTDLAPEPLLAATRRAASEHLGARTAFVVAGGGAPPFRARSFDAVVLTDVLC